VPLRPTHRELAACRAECKGRHPARPRLRNRWFVDSPLEGPVCCELVSEMGLSRLES
jgi:hypothetical protein